MITNSMIGWGDRLGAELTKLAQLTYVCLENNQSLVLWDELRYFRAGYLFLDTFNIDDVTLIRRSNAIKRAVIKAYSKMFGRTDWRLAIKRHKSRILGHLDAVCYRSVLKDYKDFTKIGPQADDVHTDKSLYNLDARKNYDVNYGFGTHQDWKKYEDVICNRLHFKPEIVEEGKKVFARYASPKKKVAVHVRLTDYLVLFSLNLDGNYYQKALSYFDPDEYQFLVFSDDIEGCKRLGLFEGRDVVYMDQNPASVDMYLMTLCDGNIIANSSFSFWGAMLNKKTDKKVVCPHDFVGPSTPEFQYINGNYYPETWIAI